MDNFGKRLVQRLEKLNADLKSGNLEGYRIMEIDSGESRVVTPEEFDRFAEKLKQKRIAATSLHYRKYLEEAHSILRGRLQGETLGASLEEAASLVDRVLELCEEGILQIKEAKP